MGMARHLKRLLTHYGIDEEKPTASPTLINRITADMERYEAVLTDGVTNQQRKVTEWNTTKTTKKIAGVYDKKEYMPRGSTGPIKKGQANKIPRTKYVQKPNTKVTHTASKTVAVGPSAKAIVKAYIALLDLLK